MSQVGRSSSPAEAPPKLLDFTQERIRTLHYTWIAFFMTFYVWFNMAPMATTMLDSVGWLTEEHVKVLLIANVALTIPARIIVGALIDRFGARVVFSGLMIVMALPALAFVLAGSFMQMLIARLVLSSVGAGFVIGIKMVAQWFPPKYIGRAEGFYAGWGNFGSAFAAMTLPWFAITVMDNWFDLGDNAWRWALGVNGFVMGAYGVMYYFLVRDVPEGEELHRAKKTEPMMVTQGGRRGCVLAEEHEQPVDDALCSPLRTASASRPLFTCARDARMPVSDRATLGSLTQSAVAASPRSPQVTDTQ